MFQGTNKWLLVTSALLVTAAFICMASDPSPGGFGMVTLWIAPPLLLAGLFLPVIAIVGTDNIVRLGSSLDLGGRKWTHLGGIIVFGVSVGVYLITLEPTASLWDCSEFIAAAYKLQVPHTPGTPLSLLVGRMFAMLAAGDETRVAVSINAMSAFFSAGSVVIVYYLILHFGRELGAMSSVRIPAATGGSLCLAFSDSFWYTAVEAEIYGIACFFLLSLLWLILKGSGAEEPLRSRLLVLIGYLSGLAYCVHPMCLLVLPVLPFVWYMKGRRLTWGRTMGMLAVGMILVLLINRLIAIGVFQLAFSIDLFFVNVIGLPFYSGVIILLVVVVLILRSVPKRFPLLQTPAWTVAFLILGFMPYIMLFIRSGKNPPIDEANPEDLYMAKAYMNRESYPSSPLLFGPYFDAALTDFENSGKVYFEGDGEYESVGHRTKYEYERLRQTILPRLYSHDDDHIVAYRQWLGLEPEELPTFAHNLEFLFTYQLGYMYLRYLMWNFAGREGDVQGSGWLKPWDRLSKGATERSRNQYWMIPLLLGLAGAIIQYRQDRKGFITNSIFFLMNGLILALYLNSPPLEPRERDYIYVASFVAFSIWIGLGLLSLQNRWIRAGRYVALVVVASICLPGWMLHQNYDDHNRAGRTFQVDYARAVLNSCPPNSILFTGGDNDTFPMWYLQDVEGYRTDVRVMVLSYFNTDWYIGQLRRRYYDSEPFKFTLTSEDYRQYGLNDVLYVDDRIHGGIDMKEYFALLQQQHPALTGVTRTGDAFHILPSRSLIVSPGEGSTLKLDVKGNYLEKNALAIVDLLVSNGWSRPLCFNYTSMNTVGLNVKPYLVQEGLIFRLTKRRHEETVPLIDRDITFRKLLEEADYSNLSDPGVNFNYEDYQMRMITPLRLSFNSLAEDYMSHGENEMAAKVLAEAIENLYHPHLAPSYANLYTSELLIALEQRETARDLVLRAFEHYYNSATQNLQHDHSISETDVFLLRRSAHMLANLDEPVYMEKVSRLGL